MTSPASTDLNHQFAAIYEQLRGVASRELRRGAPSQGGLHTTLLLHETYLRLAQRERAQWNSDTHFYALASRVVRQVLVDLVREGAAKKRGGGACHVALTSLGSASSSLSVVHLDHLLSELDNVSERGCSVVQMRIFGGLNEDEIAGELGISPRTVRREWRMARSWLTHRLQGAGDRP